MEYLNIPKGVLELAESNLSEFFKNVRPGSPVTAVKDFLDQEKFLNQISIMRNYFDPTGKKFLEIGSGYGINLALMIKNYSINGFGIEPPNQKDFIGGVNASRDLFLANNLDPSRIIEGFGESLPFESNSFEVVYSCNVLEHTNNPAKVLKEALRVLKPGGYLFMEFPNHLSWIEGHYLIFTPPLVSRRMLPIILKLYGRKADFAESLRTELNPIWTKNGLVELEKELNQEFTLKTLGAKEFLHRLQSPMYFEAKQTEVEFGTVGKLVTVLNFKNWIGKLIVFTKGWYPIYLCVQKEI